MGNMFSPPLLVIFHFHSHFLKLKKFPLNCYVLFPYLFKRLNLIYAECFYLDNLLPRSFKYAKSEKAVDLLPLLNFVVP